MRKTLLALLVATLPATQALADALPEGITSLQKGWAEAMYTASGEAREKAFERLTEEAGALVAANPDRAEPLVWKAIIESSHAGASGGLSALSLVKEARQLLEQAERIDPTVLDGSVYTSLGSLYYQVPGWPLGFGDDDKADAYLKKALAVAPDSIDANYFYADFLRERGEYAKAMAALQRALAAPPRPGREIADAGRRKEAEALIKRVRPFL